MWQFVNDQIQPPTNTSKFRSSTSWENFELDDDDDEALDDEQQAVDAIGSLKQFANSVTTGPRLNQSQRRARAKAQRSQPPPLTRGQIKQIADAVARGDIKLPEITLDSNEEWDCLWVLMESGSSIHGIDCEK